MNSALYSGWIAHRRFAPRHHAFRYRIGLLYLDLDEQDAVLGLSRLAGVSRFAPFSFRERDYLKAYTGNMELLVSIGTTAGWALSTWLWWRAEPGWWCRRSRRPRWHRRP